MASALPTIPKAASGPLQRKKAATEADKNVRIVYPTTLQPEAQDRVPTMSIADSAILHATLTQSRQIWISEAFAKFTPEPAKPDSETKEDASELTPLGLYTICIGPHMFFDTKFFAVSNPIPPSAPCPEPDSTSTFNTTTTTPPHGAIEEPPTLDRSLGSTAVTAADMVVETNTTEEKTESMSMDVDTHDDDADMTSFTETKDETLPEPLQESDESKVVSTVEFAQNQSVSSSGITSNSSGAKAKAPPSQPPRPQYQVSFEFKENLGMQWLFPYESSLEFVAAEGGEPAKIAASFYLTGLEDLRQGPTATGSDANQGPTPAAGQISTMIILNASSELWAGLQRSINDSASTYRYMMEKMKHIPPRVYVQYNLPIDFSVDKLQSLGLKKLSDHRVVPLTAAEPPKRPTESSQQQQQQQQQQQLGIKPKRAKAVHDESSTPTPKAAGTTKRASSGANTSTASSHPKRCAYCGCTSTPMWRRGPDGPHSLCNACGVKWRSGRIIIETGQPPPPSRTPGATSSSSNARQKQSTAGSKVDTESGANIEGKGSGEVVGNKRASAGAKRQDASTPSDGSVPDPAQGQKATGKKRSANRAAATLGVASSTGPIMVPIHQIGEVIKQSSKPSVNSRRGKEKGKSKEKEKDGKGERDMGDIQMALVADPGSGESTTTPSSSQGTADHGADGTSNSTPDPAQSSSTADTPTGATQAALKTSPAKAAAPKTATTRSTASKTRSKAATNDSTTQSTTKPTSLPASASAKLSLLKALASTPRYQIGSSTLPAVGLADDGLSLYATKNLYTNNTATFPLHFPTISIAFGPNNAYYMYPNCAVVLFENHFQIKLIHSGERTDIDVRKEGIESTEFQVVDVGDGESMIVMKALLRQHLSRFDKELLNPDKDEVSIVFRFRERLDGGGPPVKPLLEQWLTTEIPVGTPS
ncbi:hypothetical protein BGX34_010904 [Mortierella sp. NVP85]|nr:hypothetical protein BGX34_010904 [Mortierella sp. NVP85]